MRVLFSLQGPQAGFTRAALARVPHDAVHVLESNADPEELSTIERLATRAGARFQVESVPGDDLVAAFRAIRAAITERSGEATAMTCQVNAGKDANLLSSAGLLACLHEGVEIRFLHERGETELRVLSRAPLENLLTPEEESELSRFPDDGLPVDQVSSWDTAALNRLRDRALIALDDGALHLSERGRTLRSHVRRLDTSTS